MKGCRSVMRPLTILLIDDELEQLQSLKSFLAQGGNEIFTSLSGQKGFEIIEEDEEGKEFLQRKEGWILEQLEKRSRGE